MNSIKPKGSVCLDTFNYAQGSTSRPPGEVGSLWVRVTENLSTFPPVHAILASRTSAMDKQDIDFDSLDPAMWWGHRDRSRHEETVFSFVLSWRDGSTGWVQFGSLLI